MVGKSFIGFTVNVKLPPTKPKFVSVTERKIVAAPEAFGAGVMVKVRLLPAPPSRMLPAGNRFVSDEVAATLSKDAGVVASVTVKVIGPAVASSLIVWFPIAEIVGLAFAASRQ